MALQSSGAISINNIATEFGGSTPHSLSEYYGVDSGVPGSGEISISDFYGASNAVTQTASNNQTNIVLSSVFGSDWSSSINKIYNVPSGVNLGGTNTHAVHANSGMGGTLNIVVAGTNSSCIVRFGQTICNDPNVNNGCTGGNGGTLGNDGNDGSNGGSANGPGPLYSGGSGGSAGAAISGSHTLSNSGTINGST